MIKKNFTIGGFHSSQAQRWSETNHKTLSGILYYMFLGNKEKRMKAIRDYLEMRKGFMLEEWDEYINKIDNHLISLNQKSLTEFLSESYSEMFNMNSKYNPIGWVFNLPSYSEFNSNIKPVKSDEPIQCEKSVRIGDCEQMLLL